MSTLIWPEVQHTDTVSPSTTSPPIGVRDTKRRAIQDTERTVIENIFESTSTTWPCALARIDTLPSELRKSFELVKPIPVRLEHDDGGVIAHFGEADIAMSGEDESDALQALAYWVVDLFGDFDRMTAADLGPEPRRQLRTLRRFIRRA